MARATKPRQIFYIIVFAQFCGTSVWFAGNAVLPQLLSAHDWPSSAMAYLTSATQLGFIIGTLAFSIFGLTDKFSPSKVFFFSSICASALNMLMLLKVSSLEVVSISRFVVGITLAGIYPVGMKIAADWNESGLGQWLGALVGALVLGTAFPHSLTLLPNMPSVEAFIIVVSCVCLMGGVLMKLFVSDGPYRKPAFSFSFAALRKAFSSKDFRAPALGYFGHMWELYAMWAFIPSIYLFYADHAGVSINSSALAFFTIGAGSLGCFFGGVIASKTSSATVAIYALVSSGLCCLLSVFIWALPPVLFICFMIVWGLTMAADSPQFSALVARHAPAEVRGSAITMVVCIGFAITIVSIQLISFLRDYIPFQFIFLILLPGPLVGTMAMRRNLFKPKTL